LYLVKEYKITNIKLGANVNILRNKKSPQITNLRKLIEATNNKMQKNNTITLLINCLTHPCNIQPVVVISSF